MPTHPTVLLTGGSGVLGTALLPELAYCRPLALTHSAPCPGAAEQVPGDLTAPRLGLDAGTYAALAARVDVVVHTAAETGFSSGAAASHRLNVGGTRRLLDFVSDAGARLCHVSTSFVARRELTRAGLGRAAGDALARPEDYIDSKRAGEAEVRASGLPAVIVRPSVIIGDAASGRISAFQGLHAVIDALLRGMLPLMPVPGHSRVDFVPCDVVARVVRDLVDQGVPTGEMWATAGDSAVTVERFLELTAATARELGIPPHVPRMVGQDMIDRLIRPVFISTLRPGVRRRFDDMLAMTALFAGAGPFPCSLGRPPVAEPAPTPYAVEVAYAHTVRHFARARNLVRENAAAHRADPGRELMAG